MDQPRLRRDATPGTQDLQDYGKTFGLTECLSLCHPLQAEWLPTFMQQRVHSPRCTLSGYSRRYVPAAMWEGRAPRAPCGQDGTRHVMAQRVFGQALKKRKIFYRNVPVMFDNI